MTHPRHTSVHFAPQRGYHVAALALSHSPPAGAALPRAWHGLRTEERGRSAAGSGVDDTVCQAGCGSGRGRGGVGSGACLGASEPHLAKRSFCFNMGQTFAYVQCFEYHGKLRDTSSVMVNISLT